MKVFLSITQFIQHFDQSECFRKIKTDLLTIKGNCGFRGLDGNKTASQKLGLIFRASTIAKMIGTRFPFLQQRSQGRRKVYRLD